MAARLAFGYRTPVAALAALDVDDRQVCDPDRFIASLVKRLQASAAGAADDWLDVALDLDRLTEFQLAVVERCRRIPFGRVLTYAQLAAEAGFPGAARARGERDGEEPLPSHRPLPSRGRRRRFAGRIFRRPSG